MPKTKRKRGSVSSTISTDYFEKEAQVELDRKSMVHAHFLYTCLHVLLAVTANILIGDNSFRPAIVLVAVGGAIYSPLFGFLIGFFGNIGFDLVYGSFWLHWSVGNGIIGVLSGLIFLVPGYQPERGEIRILHAVVLVMLATVGNYVGLTLASLFDVLMDGVSFRQAVFDWAITPATVNMIFIALLAGPIVYSYGAYKRCRLSVHENA